MSVTAWEAVAPKKTTYSVQLAQQERTYNMSMMFYRIVAVMMLVALGVALWGMAHPGVEITSIITALPALGGGSTVGSTALAARLLMKHADTQMARAHQYEQKEKA